MKVIDRGSGPAVVLMPGIQGRWEWMAPTVDALAARCRVITFSLCDEPSSGFPCDPALGIANYLTQLDRVLDHVNLDEAVLIGVSYSGPIAAEFALRRRERVKALVLASALPPDWTPNRRARFYLRAPRLLAPLFALDAPARAMREIRAALPTFQERVRFSAGQLSRVSCAYVSPARMACRVRWNEHYQFGDPARIDQPVLVITGEDGLYRVVPPALTRRYVAAVADARHVVLRGTGHLGLVTKPADFAALVCDFVDQVATDDRRASA
jgi:pimeloyl-ACP methyl ester carboxylesterase